MWTVPAVIVRVVDGDTLVLDLDLGWKTWRLGERCRLEGINTPEINTPEGVAAADYVNRLVRPGDKITFASKCLDKYGRPLGTITFPGGATLNDKLIQAGHAKKM